jgi:hypothetical protein
MRQSCWKSVATILAVSVAAPAWAHDAEHGHGGGTNYYAFIDDFHSNPSTTDATGEIFLRLNEERTALSYKIVLDDLLGFKENPAERTEPDDIIGMHLHIDIDGRPHVLNIFGWRTWDQPAEEDSDLVIDYENRTLTGIWDDSDATRDPVTGELEPQFFPLTSKLLTGDYLHYLFEDRLMVAVHTNESGFPAMAIHGHIHAVAPEPSTDVFLLAAIVSVCGLTRVPSVCRGK